MFISVFQTSPSIPESAPVCGRTRCPTWLRRGSAKHSFVRNTSAILALLRLTRASLIRASDHCVTFKIPPIVIPLNSKGQQVTIAASALLTLVAAKKFVCRKSILIPGPAK